jgi:Fic family protein
MKKINKRQSLILSYVKKNNKANNQEIKDYLEKKNISISRYTIIRDLDILINNGFLHRIGKGRSISYQVLFDNVFFDYYDVDEYFSLDADEREVLEKFNFDIFNKLNNVFNKDEFRRLLKINNKYTERIKTLSPTIIKKEFERLTIELSWKSSKIEGNTYSLIDTEILIRKNQEAKGKKKEEAIMILNHKKAIDFIRDKNVDFKNLTLKNIENIHSLLVDSLDIPKGIRKRMVGITGTKYSPIDNEFQIKEALLSLIKVVNELRDPFSKAIVVILMISYIQPFEDGNKRTGRILGDAILLAFNVCPLSYRSIDEADYKKAMLLFYEQNSGAYFKDLFVEQFRFAVKNYFQ